ERRKIVRIGGFYGSGDPIPIFVQEIPDGLQKFRVVTLEVEMQNDQGPARAIIFTEFSFDDGPHVLEKRLSPGRFRTRGPRFVCDHYVSQIRCRINVPGKILLDGDWKTHFKRTL